MKKVVFTIFFVASLPVVFSQVADSADAILVKVDIKPTWESCVDVQDSKSREICLEKNLASFFNDFIIYPDRARKKKLEGQVVVQFVVEKDGSISNIQIIRDIGEGCGDEVVRAIKHLPKLVPALNDGKPVRVLYKAPFHFLLK